MQLKEDIKSPLFGEIFRFSLPIVADQAFVTFLTVINLIMCGGAGTAAVSAVGLVDSLNSTVYQFFISLAAGGNVVVAQNMGRGNQTKAGQAAWQALMSGTIFSAVITIAILIFKVPILNGLFGRAAQDVMVNSLAYLSISIFSYPMLFYTMQGYGILRSCGNSYTPMKINIVTTVVDLVCGVVLICGIPIGGIVLGGFGIMGVAWTVIISRTIATVLVTLALSVEQNGMKMAFKPYYKPDKELLRTIYGIGIPASTESIIFMAGRLLTQSFVASMGTVAIAVNNIGNSLTAVMSIPGNAYGIVATTVVGKAVGKGDEKEVRRSLSYSMKIGSVLLWIVCLVFFVCAPMLSRLYSADAEVIAKSAFLIRCFAVASIVWPFSFIYPGGFRGASDVKYSLLVGMASMWACRVVLGYVLGVTLQLGVTGVWCAMYVDWMIRAVMYYTRYKKGTWLKSCGLYKGQ